MKIKIETIGNASIEFDVISEKKAIEVLAFWQSLPQRCGSCGAEITFTFRQPQGFTYYGVECYGMPKHEATFGQHKEGDGLFFKSEWKEVQRGYAEEQGAEIAKYDNPPQQNAPSNQERINKAIVEIKSLKGTITPQGQNESDTEYLASLIEQYKRLKG